MLRRVDGDGLQRVERVHAGLDRHACAERQILLRNDRVVGDDGHVAARVGQHAGGFPGFVLQLKLAGKRQARADSHRHVLFFCQLVRNEMPLGHVLQRQAQIELPRNAQRRKDVVGLVGVGL